MLPIRCSVKKEATPTCNMTVCNIRMQIFENVYFYVEVETKIQPMEEIYVAHKLTHSEDKFSSISK